MGTVVAQVADAGRALFSAVWPRSMAKFEVDRLAADGYAAGEAYDVDFSVALESELADVAFPALRQAGYAIGGALGDGSRRKAAEGFVTVRRRVRLRAYDLSRESARLNRLAGRFGGWAAVIGPATPPPSASSSPSSLADTPAAFAPVAVADAPPPVAAADAILPGTSPAAERPREERVA